MLHAWQRQPAVAAQANNRQSHEQAMIGVTIDNYPAFNPLGLPAHNNRILARSHYAACSPQLYA
jgi:hypothetical protein